MGQAGAELSQAQDSDPFFFFFAWLVLIWVSPLSVSSIKEQAPGSKYQVISIRKQQIEQVTSSKQQKASNKQQAVSNK